MNLSPVIPAILLFAALSACATQNVFDARLEAQGEKPVREVAGNAEAGCASDPSWLPKTQNPKFTKPLPHPAPDCDFYKAAWQTFLFVTQPGKDGNPAFLGYPGIPQIGGDRTATNVASQRSGLLSLASNLFTASKDSEAGPSSNGNTGPVTPLDAGMRQAGLGGILIDQNGSPVFYGIHMNDKFFDFVLKNKLTTKQAIEKANPQLAFPRGSVELKSSWQIVSDAEVAGNYITAKALVPALKKSGGSVHIDTSTEPRQVTAALLALHVVFVLEGHPEFIWSTFEHVDKDGNPDLTPTARALPASKGLPGGVDDKLAGNDFVLYKAGTLASKANTLHDDQALWKTFDSTTQTFKKNGKPYQTSVYRAYPASKLIGIEEDEDIVSLNENMLSRLGGDRRGGYRLVGAVWLDRPEKTFFADQTFSNPPGVTSDDGPVAGEDGLSSIALESFTQDSFVNCLSCHNTSSIGSPDGAKVLMNAKKINVSHILSKYLTDLPVNYSEATD